MDISDDRYLCDDLNAGSEKAFELVFDRYHRLIYALAYRYLQSGAEAEDAVQYVFMRLWEHRETLDFSKGIRSLLFTMLKNYVLNELRHRSVVLEKHKDLEQQQQEETEDFFQHFEQEELRGHLHVAIARLPPQKQKICLLKMEENLSNQEIADKLGVAVPTVKSHYTQAIKQLRSMIDKLLLILLFY